MLVETKAKVGVFSIALGAYLPQFPSLVPEFEAQYDAFKKTLPDTRDNRRRNGNNKGAVTSSRRFIPCRRR